MDRLVPLTIRSVYTLAVPFRWWGEDLASIAGCLAVLGSHDVLNLLGVRSGPFLEPYGKR